MFFLNFDPSLRNCLKINLQCADGHCLTNSDLYQLQALAVKNEIQKFCAK